MPAFSSRPSADGSTAPASDPKRPSGTVTFLFSDIEGSTRLWERQPEAMSAALARHDALMQQAIDAAGGFVFKTVGDAFHAVFAQPKAALAAALAAQTTLHSEVWTLAEGTIQVRMALHTGDAEVRDDDYFGAALSRTARLLAAGHGGQTLLSETASALVSGSLPAGVRLRSLGRHRFKDLAQAQEVSDLVAPGLPSVFPVLRSLESFPNNLPAQLTAFIGRETEMTAARPLLAASRLLTLTGMGGSGKTRLALQVAAESLESYPDGIWLVELAALSDPDLVAQEVAGVLGVREESEKKLLQTLRDTLRPQSVLLILDNCEHVIDAAARLSEALLQACPKLSILATSREALGIGGETVLPLASLSMPALGTAAATPDALAGCEAVRFFVERAQAALPAFRYSTGNAAAVASVCSRLDGIPLALELAAARVRVLTPEQIDGRLDDRFRLLSGGSRTALPRQQTLRALVDWSYDLLGEAEQTLLCRLSVFAGGWSLAAAETVCAGGSVEDWEVLDLLSRLAAKSLLVVEPPEAGQVHYRLLESIRSYARDRLAQMLGEADALAQKHRNFFLALAEEAEPELSGASQALWLNVLERDGENLRAALALSRSEGGDSLPRLAGALSRFWYGRSFLSEGTGWLEAALSQGPEGAMLGKVLNGLGMLAQCCNEFDKSRTYHERDLAVERELQDPRGIARALGNLCMVITFQQQFDQAEAYGQESLALYRSLEDKTASARMLTNLGVVALQQGDYLRAERLYREALLAYQETGDAGSATDALHNLGDLFLRQGLYAQAAPYFRESLRAQRTLGNTQRTASTVIHLAEVAGAEENYVRVCLFWAAADHLLQVHGITAFSQLAEYQATLDKSRTVLGEEQFAVIWAQGQRMSETETINLALESHSGFSMVQY